MSKKENVRFLPPVKRYVNAVERRLHLPLREKARVMSDISTSIAARHEAGESYEAIMADMGTPEAVAQPFNQAFAGQYKGSAWRFLWLALALAVLATTAAVLIFTAGMARGMEMAFLPQAFPWAGASSAGIIGGADGPTAVFVTSYAGIFSMGPLDALVTAGALLSFYFLCRAAGIHGCCFAQRMRKSRKKNENFTSLSYNKKKNMKKRLQRLTACKMKGPCCKKAAGVVLCKQSFSRDKKAV